MTMAMLIKIQNCNRIMFLRVTESIKISMELIKKRQSHFQLHHAIFTFQNHNSFIKMYLFITLFSRKIIFVIPFVKYLKLF